MKTRSFFTGLSWLLALNLLVKPAWIFLVDRQVQNRVGNEAYGSYFALFNLTYVLAFASDAGLTNMLTQGLAAGTRPDVRRLFRVKLLLLLLYAAGCVTVAWLTGVRQWTLLLPLVLLQMLSSLFLFLRGLLAGAQLFKTDAVFSVVDKGFLLLLCAGPLYGFWRPMTVGLFLQLQLAATSLSVLGLLVFCLRRRLVVSSATGDSLRAIARQTAPFLLIMLLMATHYRLDGFLLERLHPSGAAEAGVYAAAYRLLDAGNMLGYLCASFLVPFVARNRNDQPIVSTTLLLTRHGLLVAGVGVAAFVAVYAPWLQRVLYHTELNYPATVLRLCLAVLPAYYLVHVYGSALTAVGAFRMFIIILLFSVIANAALNVVLIPSFGAAGCCAAALVSQYGCGIALWITASRRLSLRYGATTMVGYALAAVLCWIVFLLAKTWGSIVWIILVAACVALAAVLARKKSRVQRLFSVFNS